MKKFAILMVLAVIGISQVTCSQNLIAVQNGGNPAFYSKLDSALIHAQTGDTLFIPGGAFHTTTEITKKMVLIGVGFDTDSTAATSRSFIGGDITFGAGSSHSTMTGIVLSGSIYSAQNVNYVTISRCQFQGLRLYSDCHDWVLTGNEVFATLGSFDSPGAGNCLFSNNLIRGAMGGQYGEVPGFTNCIFRNNIFFSGAHCYSNCYYPIKSPSSLIENNVFLGFPSGGASPTMLSADYSIVDHNLFVNSWFCPGSCSCNDNFIQQPSESIFIAPTFHLQLTSSGKNGGTDGTDLGIYGGTFPWKEGAVPFTPHIQMKTISGTTDSNGNLNVNIKVAAQDR